MERYLLMSVHRWFVTPAVFMLLVSYGDLMPSTRAGDFSVSSEPLDRIGPVEASSVWVVVNLFSGRNAEKAVRVRKTLERLGAGGQGVVLPYREVTVENILRLRPAFLALSPNGVPWCDYTGDNGTNLQNFLRALRIIVEKMNVPVIGICGGHQALALAFGGKVGPILGGEDDCLPYGKDPTERGRHTITVVRKDPLLIGMGDTLNLVENHYDEVKRLPRGFLCLASNRLCRYQIMRHPTRPAYGVQAHTEYYLASKPDGGTLLRNFLHIVRTHNRLCRTPNVMNSHQRAMSKENSVTTREQTW
jgi:GMP synthase (glutamine-hydrolysing)